MKTQDVLNNPTLTSSAFSEGSQIPSKYSCDGENISPPLSIRCVETSAKSLALIVEDPDAPVGLFTHWILWNINPVTTEINEGSVPVGSLEGTNDAGSIGYAGPCPPSGTHRYIFRLYTLKDPVNLPQKATRQEFQDVINGHILSTSKLTGHYTRNV